LAELSFQPTGQRHGFLRGSAQSLRDVWSYRELLSLLVKRELKARYKDSTLGFLWSLLRPLAQLLIYYVALGKFLGAERAIPDYAIFVFTGLTAWALFSEIVASGTGSIVANAGLVKKVLATFIAGAPPTGTRLLYFPLGALVLLVYGMALAFLLSAMNVYLRDIQYLVEIMLMVLFWTTPIVYSWEQAHKQLGSGFAGHLYDANPLTSAVLAFQRAFWVAGSGTEGPPHLAVTLGWQLLAGVALLWACQRVFARLQANFAQEL
jgi:ABC-2 type transport system permease protein